MLTIGFAATGVDQATVGFLLIALIAALIVFVFYPALVDRNSDAATTRPTVVTLLHGGDSAAAAATTTTQPSPPPLLSVIIPAYEEEVRLPRMLLDAFTYLNSAKCTALTDFASISISSNGSSTSSLASSPRRLVVEWIVVNDGSKDSTSQVYRDFIDTHVSASTTDPKKTGAGINSVWKLIVLDRNRGKGAAVRTGMLAATGDFCLMVDADGATDFAPGLDAIVQRLKTELSITAGEKDSLHPLHSHRYPILLGSRAHLQDDTSTEPPLPTTAASSAAASSSAAAKAPSTTTLANATEKEQSSSTPRPPKGRSLLRALLMYVFHWCVVVLIGANDVRDTQCGFKLFHRSAAVTLFRNLHLQRWAFDTELLFLATQLRYELKEVDIAWHDVAGSKLHTSALNLALVSVCMLRDMACVRLCYTLGLWKIRRKED